MEITFEGTRTFLIKMTEKETMHALKKADEVDMELTKFLKIALVMGIGEG